MFKISTSLSKTSFIGFTKINHAILYFAVRVYIVALSALSRNARSQSKTSAFTVQCSKLPAHRWQQLASGNYHVSSSCLNLAPRLVPIYLFYDVTQIRLFAKLVPLLVQSLILPGVNNGERTLTRFCGSFEPFSTLIYSTNLWLNLINSYPVYFLIIYS